MVQKPAGAVFCRNAREKIRNFLSSQEGWMGEVGNFPENPCAIDVRGFPLRWETRGSQDRRLALCFFYSFSDRSARRWRGLGK
jgi:hypothetical protein